MSRSFVNIKLADILPTAMPALLLAVLIAPGNVTGTETMELLIGHTEVIAFNKIERVSVGDGDVIDVKVLNESNQTLVIAKKIGVTDLRLWGTGNRSQRYIVRVIEPSAEYIRNRVEEHLGQIHGVTTRIVDGSVVMEGRVSRDDDMARITTLASNIPNVVNYVMKSQVDYRTMVRLDVKVLEFKKRALKSLGINWAQSVNGPTFGVVSDWRTNNVFRAGDASGLTLGAGLTALPLDVGTKAYFGLTSSVASVIDLLIQNGHARLLAEPNLSCRSGGKADFRAGGEIPYPTTGSMGGTNVEFKSYGVALSMEPHADPDGYIATKINVEISSIDPAVTVMGLPGILSRVTSTELNVKSGQTMVLAGLLSSEASETVNRVPGLSAIPILGELFKSKGFQSSETELVILVTPSVTGPETEKNNADVRRFEELAKTSEKRLVEGILD